MVLNKNDASILQGTDFDTLVYADQHEGVYYGLNVTQSGVGTSLNIMVGSGMAIVQGNRTIGSFYQLAIGAADANFKRYDLVEMRSNGTPIIVAGTAAGIPSVPDLTSGAIPLALVTVGSNVTAIANANIRDVRIKLLPSYTVIENTARTSMAGLINTVRTPMSGTYPTLHSFPDSTMFVYDEMNTKSGINYTNALTTGENPARYVGSLGMLMLCGSLYDQFNSAVDFSRWSGNDATNFVETGSSIQISRTGSGNTYLLAIGSSTAGTTAGEFREKNIDAWALITYEAKFVANAGVEGPTAISLTVANNATNLPAGSRVFIETRNMSAVGTERFTRIVHFDRTGSQVRVYTPALGSNMLTVATTSLSTLAGSWYLGITVRGQDAGDDASGAILNFWTQHDSGLSGIFTSFGNIVDTDYKLATANISLGAGSYGLMKTAHSFDSGTTYTTTGSMSWLARSTVNNGSYVLRGVYNFPPPHAGSDATYNFCVIKDWESILYKEQNF